jgi:hypothetical protein
MSILDKFQPEKTDMKDVYSEPDVEKQLELETKKLLKRKQADQMHDMRDTQYYCVLVFGNEFDKNKFLNIIDKRVTVEGETFIDGYEFSKSIGTEIQVTAKLPEPHHINQIKIKSNGNKIGRQK